MSRFFFNKPAFVSTLKDLALLMGQDYAYTFGKYADDAAMNVAAHIGKILGSQHQDFVNLLNETRPASVSCKVRRVQAKVFAYVKENDTDKVTFFPNLPAPDSPDLLDTYGFSTVMYFDTAMHSLVTAYEAALADDRRRAGWMPVARGVRRIKQRQTTTMARFITNYTNASDYDVTSAEIRDWSVAMEEALKPQELHWAIGPKDFTAMYSSGGPSSCMTVGDHDYFDFLFEKYGLAPASFYGYHPHIRGAYIRRHGHVAARTICYEDEDGTQWFGRVYSADTQSRNTLRKLVKAAGYKDYSECWDDYTYYRECEFDIPGCWNEAEEDWCFPMPYFDCMAGEVKATFDSETHVFHIECDRGDGNVETQSTSGYVRARYLERYICQKCGCRIYADEDMYVHRETGHLYCSESCLDADGLCRAQRSDGQWVVVYKSMAYQDAAEEWHWYTNEEAARAVGAKPFLTSLLDVDEDPRLGHSYYHTYLDGQVYACLATVDGPNVVVTQPVFSLEELTHRTVIWNDEEDLVEADGTPVASTPVLAAFVQRRQEALREAALARAVAERDMGRSPFWSDRT